MQGGCQNDMGGAFTWRSGCSDPDPDPCKTSERNLPGRNSGLNQGPQVQNPLRFPPGRGRGIPGAHFLFPFRLFSLSLKCGGAALCSWKCAAPVLLLTPEEGDPVLCSCTKRMGCGSSACGITAPCTCLEASPLSVVGTMKARTYFMGAKRAECEGRRETPASERCPQSRVPSPLLPIQ